VKILVIRFSSIGDIVLTTPVLRCIKNDLPNAEIHYLTKPQFLPLLENNPHLKKVWVWSGEVLTSLREEGFDHVVDLHHNLRSLRVKWALGVKSTAFQKLNLAKYLMVRFKWNRLPEKHIVDRYLETVSKLGVKWDGKGLEFFPSPESETIFSKLPNSYSKGFVVVVCGALKGTKQIPVEHLISVCKNIQSPVVLLGGKQEVIIGKEIQQELGSKVLDLCGETTLGESAVLLRESLAVLTADTGLMHIASAFQKPIVSVWGNTIPEFGMSPFMPENPSNSFVAQVEGLSCRPCSKIGFPTCPKGHFNCMQKQKYPAIADRINRFAEQKNS
jgi:ADP-heptose:LPS heptosyltransferase